MGWLTYEQSLARARQLKARIEAYGVPVSIELQRGSGNSKYWGHDWFAAEMSHHVASRRSQGATPFLSLVKNGRGGALPVPGPLCNGYMGFDGIYRIITMGLANHPGKGGPFTAGLAHIPADQGRYLTWGTEFEGGMNAADWDPSFHLAMGRVNAGIIDWLGQDMPIGRQITVTDRNHLEHSSWAFGRKVDRIRMSREDGIAEIGQARALATPTEEDDEMSKADVDRIVAAIDKTRIDVMAALAKIHTDAAQANDNANKAKVGVGRLEVKAEEPTLDVEELAGQLAKQLPSNLARNLTEEIVRRLNESRAGQPVEG